jgi:hypothetical protein
VSRRGESIHSMARLEKSFEEAKQQRDGAVDKRLNGDR